MKILYLYLVMFALTLTAVSFTVPGSVAKISASKIVIAEVAADPVCHKTVSGVPAYNSVSGAVSGIQDQAPSQDGKTFCYNYDDDKNKIKKTCDCYRACFDGVPGRDAKCVNHCFEDKCQCRTQCSS